MLVAAVCVSTGAQTNGSNSPYSRFGLGVLNDQSQSANRAMGGLAYGLRTGNRLNMLNPASYSAIDSLSFLFDVGMSMQHGNMKGGGTNIHVNNTTLDFVNAGFRIRKGLGMSLGFVPYSTIGYNFSQTNNIGPDFTTGTMITSNSLYSGEGGLHQMYIGIGWNPFGTLSVGANMSYMWGNYNHTLSQQFLEGGAVSSLYNGLNAHYKASLKTYKVDLGAQYSIPVGSNDELTIGAVVSLGHTINSTARLYHFTSNGDSIVRSVPKAFELPYSFGGGLAWRHKRQWTAGIDVNQEQWSQCRMPMIASSSSSETGVSAGAVSYESHKGAYLNRTRITAGAEYVPDIMSRHYLRRIHYRMGATFSTPYVKVDGEDGPRTYSVSAGVGLPITNNRNNRSMINVSFQWLKVAPSQTSMISENYFKINLGITFNERWFMKWKIN